MTSSILRWLQGASETQIYVTAVLGSSIEYVFPPFPGDTISLFSIFLGIHASVPVWTVFLALLSGSLLGGVAAYGIGHALGRWEDKPGRKLPLKFARALSFVRSKFAHRAGLYIMLNRFVPAVRGLCFVAAGYSGYSLLAAMVYGAVSSLLWNSMLVIVAWLLSENWERLQQYFAAYTWSSLLLAFAAVVLWLWRPWKNLRQSD